MTFRLVVVFTVFSQDKVLPHRVDFLAALMREFKGVFALFPVRKKCGVGPHSGSELGADFALWTPAAYAESRAGAYDVVAQSEAVAVPVAAVEVEDAAARLAAGFPAQNGSACSSSSTSWDGPGGGVPTATGAPSLTHGLSVTRKLQPMSYSLPRTFLAEDVVVASGPGGCRLAVAGGTRRRTWRLAARSC